MQTTSEVEGTEILLAGTVQKEALNTFLQGCPLPPDETVLMLMETHPHRVITPEERQDMLYFAIFDPDFDFSSYTSGRIFHAQGEIRWEQQDDRVRCVYTGDRAYKPALQDPSQRTLPVAYNRTYILLGKRLIDEQQKRINAHPGDFAEIRIPRLLRYPQLPATKEAERMQLVVCEYVDPATGHNYAYRFRSLVPFQKQR